MKNLLTLILTIATIVALPSICWPQDNTEPEITKRPDSVITSVRFPLTAKNSPTSAEMFFKNYLKTKPDDDFRKTRHNTTIKGFVHEHFDQYYRGIKVDDAGYNFHYKNEKMFLAHGHYVVIGSIDPNPSISPLDARDMFQKYKRVPFASIVDFKWELLIKEIPIGDRVETKLVYWIYLNTDHENNTEVGYLDAHTGDTLLTMPIVIDWSATGTFETRYSGIRDGTTQNYNGVFNLADSTRGAVIHTWSLQNITMNTGLRVEITDNDNDWTAAEHAADSTDMGLDVHWGLQQVYDYMLDTHGINSFDDGGFPINAYVRAGSNNDQRDNAYWRPADSVLLFGQGVTYFRPMASIDVIAHEYGHGIKHFQINSWNSTEEQLGFNEGLSDIWAAILEERIRPSTTWRIGEQVTLTHPYLRNLENTKSPSSLQQIENTFGTYDYNKGNRYVKGGVFSHWFYLLVNGGYGLNGLGNSYNVHGVGMEMAENLIVTAVFGGYLSNTTSYAGIRNRLVDAANSLCSGNGVLVQQVEAAWYAVGVGTQPPQSFIQSPFTFYCGNNYTFSASQVPTGVSYTWSNSDNLTYISGQGTANYVVRPYSGESAWVEVALSDQCGTINTIDHIIIESSIHYYDIVISGDELCYPNRWYTFEVANNSSTPATGWVWHINDYNWEITYQEDNSWGSYIDVELPQYYYGYETEMWVEARTQCGTALSEYYYTQTCSEPYSIYPNPADQYLEVGIKNESESDLKDITKSQVYSYIKELKLYNDTNELVKQGEFKAPTTRIETADLQPGLYILHVIKIDGTDRKEVMIGR